MKSLSLLMCLVLATPVAFAGKQRVSAIDRASYSVQPMGIEVSGLAQGTRVQGLVQLLNILGTLEGSQCQQVGQCLAEFSISGNDLIATIGMDLDQDGNYEKIIQNQVLGKLMGSHLKFIAPVQANWVQDRYSWMEKLSGMKDRDYPTLTLILNK